MVLAAGASWCIIAAFLRSTCGVARIQECVTARGSRIMCSRYGSTPGMPGSSAAADGTFDESTISRAPVTSAIAR